MAEIFVSFTKSDQQWAHWIAQELTALDHEPHVHDWEIGPGEDIVGWMEKRHDQADYVLCVVSPDYLNEDKAPFSTWERRAALWRMVKGRKGHVLLFVVKPVKLPSLIDHFRRCDLVGLKEAEARRKIAEFLSSPAPPEKVEFPGEDGVAVSNVPVAVPEHFLGREDALGAVDAALKRHEGRVAITAVHGLRGVGKTTLAAAYAERHRGEYRATWWVRAQAADSMRADLVALGVRLDWVAADEKEAPAFEKVMERLRREGEGLLIIYDSATQADALKPFLPKGGAARVLVTSNAPDWRGLAAPIELKPWPKDMGADYLIARTGRTAERGEAEALSEALGGLPLAHEQAAAYCERLSVSFADYARRLAATPIKLLDAEKDAPLDYHDKLTVAKTFALAIDEAAKLNPAAEPLIFHTALLAPEPIPLFLFSEGREKFGEPLASDLSGDGLDEAVAALRAFALVDRETIVDERDPAITTDTIRLHRLVRAVAADRRRTEEAEAGRRVLIEAMAAVYPSEVDNDPRAWPRARRLDPLALDLVARPDPPPRGAENGTAYLLDRLAKYRQAALAAYGAALPLFERALMIRENALGPEHWSTATILNNLANLLRVQGDLAGARPLHERALAIRERALGPEHPATATSLNNLGSLLEAQGDLAGARPLFERALAIREKAHGPDHRDTATSLNNIAGLLYVQGDLASARSLFERVLAIREKAHGPEHPDTAVSLNNLAELLQAQNDLVGARPLRERALAITEKALGPEHPATAWSLNNFAGLLYAQGDLAGARSLFERALAIREKALGPEHPDTANSLNNLAGLLQDQGDLAGARPPYERALAICEKALGPEHPLTATTLDNLAGLLRAQGDLAGARPLYDRALAIREKTLGADHRDTGVSLNHLASLLRAQGDLAGARPLYERALAICEKALGPGHRDTAMSLHNLASLLRAQGDLAGARPLYDRALAIREKTLGLRHPDTAVSLNNLGSLLEAQGDLAGARPLFERALAIDEKVYGSDHPEVAADLNNLALLLQSQGDLPGARLVYERALTIFQNARGPEHPDTARSLNNLASLLLAEGDLAGARPLFEQALAINEKSLGPGHPATILVRNNLANLRRPEGPRSNR